MNTTLNRLADYLQLPVPLSGLSEIFPDSHPFVKLFHDIDYTCQKENNNNDTRCKSVIPKKQPEPKAFYTRHFIADMVLDSKI